MVEPARSPEGDEVSIVAGLGQIVLGDEPLGVVLERVAGLAVGAIPCASEASVTLVEGEQGRTVASTGPAAVRLDERQYETGWGPCLDAAATGHRVVVDTSTPDATPYPDFAGAAQRAGFAHTFSVPLPVADRVFGALNLYSRHTELEPTAVDAAERFAAYAGVTVANATLYSSTAERADHLVAAMRSRAVIEQAKGIVMAQRGCDADEAFAVLVKASQHRNVKLRDVALAVVRAASTPGEELDLPA